MNSFSIFGGDERSRCLARSLYAVGNRVLCCGLGSFDDFQDTDIKTACGESDIAVFPHIPTKDGASLFAPLSSVIIPLGELGKLLRGKKVYTGGAEALAAATGLSKTELIGYDRLESYLAQNARLTAEAALMLAIENSPLAIYKASCLVTGYGRIGSALCNILAATGARILISEPDALKEKNAIARGCVAVKPGQLEKVAHDCDFVFNTCVADVLTEAVVDILPGHALVIDIASAPGGCDYAACDRHGIKYIKALGLPGRYSPQSAGEIIAQTILNIEEGSRWRGKE